MTENLSHGEQLLGVNGAELCAQTFGNTADPAILLIHGACASMLWWEAELCERIAARGRFVIRYDNRDTGRSTSYPPGRPGYSLTGLAADALGILDALGIQRAHIVSRSMAAGIGLIIGVDHPARAASLTFITTTTGDPSLPPPPEELADRVPANPDPADPAAVADFIAGLMKAYSGGSAYFDEAAVRALAEQDVARTCNLASALTNHYAMTIDWPARGGFGDISAPALVVHGDLDPVFPLQHGQALRDAIPGAQLLVLEGAGHDVPRPLWDVFVPALVRHSEDGRP
jgi:pimeloyl-ACP methyl ester carboxylesterase